MSNEAATETFYIEFGSRVRNARLNAGLTQAELASHLRLTRSSVANIESGRQRVQVHIMAVLARTLNTSLDSLVPPLAEPDGPKSEILRELDMQNISDTAQRFVAEALQIADAGRSNGTS